MTDQYKEEVIGSAIRCYFCGAAMTRGRPCESCERRSKEALAKLAKLADRCLCGGVGCNSCEPQGRG